MLNFLLARLREPSTWAGLASIMGTAAHAIATRDPQAIVATLAGVAAVLVPEHGRPRDDAGRIPGGRH
jgi:hypothetical protein